MMTICGQIGPGTLPALDSGETQHSHVNETEVDFQCQCTVRGSWPDTVVGHWTGRRGVGSYCVQVILEMFCGPVLSGPRYPYVLKTKRGTRSHDEAEEKEGIGVWLSM